MTDPTEDKPREEMQSSTGGEEKQPNAHSDDEKHVGLIENAAESFTREEFETAKRVLATIVKDRGQLADIGREEHQQLQFLTGRVARPDAASRKKLVRARRRTDKATRREQDDARRQAAEIRKLRLQPVFVTPPGTSALAFEAEAPALLSDGSPADARAPTGNADSQEQDKGLHEARRCYVCKNEYRTLHAFYDQLCPPCGDLNFQKREPKFDLTGRVALLTGSRVKIGYHAAIFLLRNGARVIATTRFPHDAAARYAAEPDFAEWKERLEIYGLDLRHTPSVETFCEHLAEDLPSLDFVIHNACQTVRRPPEFYAHMLDGEKSAVAQLPAAERALVEKYDVLRHRAGVGGIAQAAELSQARTDADAVGIARALPESVRQMVEIFPSGKLDADLQQVDLRSHNSWRLKLNEVPTIELLEVLLVNAVAPFVFSSRLRGLMTRVPSLDKHIVNVSAMEGQFHRNKTDKHPHTNMAKAALNMLTRTSAQDYVRDGIHMNAVDTGWITDEDPAHIAERKVEMHQFSPPLDVVDGAARIVDPIFAGLSSGNHVWGQFLKDYAPTYW